MWLLIDDGRNLSCDIIARTAKAGKLILDEMSKRIEGLCIDHDLGTLETGCDVVKWAIANNCLPDKVQVVTMNPVGRQNIINVLVDNGYRLKDNTFVKG